MGFLTGINLLGAGLGFAIGVLGYIIVRYWIRPAARYGRLKGRAADAVKGHLAILEGGLPGSGEKARINESKKRLRRLASELTDVYHQELPHWYRIRLRARQEDVPSAAGGLMKLSGIRDPAQAKKRAGKIRRILRLV